MYLNNIRDKDVCIIAIFLAFLTCLPMLIFNQEPVTDLSRYYGPMISAFARNDWQHAYYPLIPPLFPTIGGIISKITDIEAQKSAQLVSITFFALTTVPLFHLIKKIFSRKIAITSVILFIFCDRVIRYAGSGHLTTTKIFFVITTIYLLLSFRDSKKWGTVILLAITLAGLSLLRTEGVLLAAIAGVWLLFYEIKSVNGKNNFHFPIKSITAAMLIFIIIFPWLCYQYQMIGYPVTDSRQIRLIDKLPKSFSSIFNNKAPIMKEESTFVNNNVSYDNSVDKIMKKSLWERFIVEFIKGLIPVYLLISLPIVWIRIKNKKWTRDETILLTVIIGHTLLLTGLLGGFWTSKRYVIPVMPLLLGWTAIGVNSLFVKIKRSQEITLKSKLIIIRFVMISFILVSTMNGIHKTRKYLRGKDDMPSLIKISQWITKEGIKMIPETQRPLSSTIDYYHTGTLPLIMTHSSKATFIAGTDILHPDFGNDVNVDMVKNVCTKKGVNFIILSNSTIGCLPSEEELIGTGDFFKVLKTGRRDIFTVLAYRPNIINKQ